MIRVTAALAWWNERPADLTACVTAVANVADRIVAVDGAYRRYPGATVRSSNREVAAIRKAAAAAGIECVIHQPDELWAGQVAKRTFLLQEAAKDSDWIVVIDADHIVQTDRVAARGALEAMPAKVRSVGVDFFTPANSRDRKKKAATGWHENAEGTTVKMAHIFRSYPDYRVEKKHWLYYATSNGQPIELAYGGAPNAMIGVPYKVTHLTLFRTEAQILASRAFCNDRVMVVRVTGQEDDVPGLPEPVWDYETMPYVNPAAPPRVPSVEKERVRSMTLSTYKPPQPWSHDDPNVVLTLREAARGLEKGYQVMTRMRGNDLAPEVPAGNVIVLAPASSGKTGDALLAKVRSEVCLARLNADGKLADKRGKVLREPKAIYGVLTYHGPHWPEKKAPEPKAEKPVKVKAEKLVKVEKTAPVAPKRRGRPPKADGRKAVAAR